MAVEQHRHQRRSDTEGAIPHQRATDRDKVLAWGYEAQKWIRLVMPVLLFLSGIFMATVWRPIRSIPGLQIQVEELAKAQRQETADRRFMDSLSFVQRTDLAKGMQITNRILCFNMNRADRIKYDIDCSNIPLPEK